MFIFVFLLSANQAKTDWRSSLGSTPLTDLTISLHAPDIEHFNPEQALDLWEQAAPGRPSYSQKLASSASSFNSTPTEKEAPDIQADKGLR